MTPERGDVVLIVVPGDLGKPRPAVVVQSNTLGERRTIVVCPMSSDTSGAPSLRPIVEPAAANGLPVRSQVMTDKIAVVRRDRVRQVIGRLDQASQARLDQSLLVVLGLAG